jgi:hypothetical protein
VLVQRLVKNAVLIVLSLLVLVAYCHRADAWGLEPLSKDPYDKLSHAIAGATIRTMIDDHLKGALAAFAVGLAKEATDKHFDIKDAGAWVAGVRVEYKF